MFFPETFCLGEFSAVVFQECFLSLDSAVSYKWAADALLLHVLCCFC